MKKIFFLLITTALLSACKNNADNEHVYLFNSAKVDCDAGAGKSTCYMVKKLDDNSQDVNEINAADWQLFYSEVKGFDFEPGYLYKLRIKETPVKNAPADSSNIDFSLVEIMEKKQDSRMAINDIWLLQTIAGENAQDKMANNRQPLPQIEITLANMRVAGTDSCNQISGSIKTLDESNIAFSQLISTRRACPDMQLANEFTQAIQQVAQYQVNNGVLTLLDTSGNELLSFKKVD